jgi:putative ABC transport system permease protein
VRHWLRRMLRRVRAVVHRGALDRELDAEMRFHIDMEAEELARMYGLAAGEARRRARIAFGGVERYKEEHRDARGVRWAEELVHDARYAARSLRRSPGFTLLALLILALGIGSTTAVFSAVDAVLLDPDDDRLAVIFLQRYPSLSAVDFFAIEAQQRSFTAVGALRRREAAYTAGGEPERVRVGAATSGFFRALGVRPARGRLIAPSDERVGAPPVVLVSHALAARTLGGDAAAIGRAVTIDGIAHTVVGVLPAGVRELAGYRADIWPVLQLAPPERRGPFGLLVIGRLRPGVTFEAATRDVAAISERIFPLWASGYQDRSARFAAIPIRAAILGDGSRMLPIFAVAVGLVLLIAVANVASLMLVRAIGRWDEVSLRAVLGATRARLVKLFVIESIVLAGAGGIVGIGAGALGLRALIALAPQMPRLASAHLDLRAAAVAAGAALLAGMIVGLSPVVRLLEADGAAARGGGERTIGPGPRTHAIRSAFVIAQFALALPLLAIAGLLLNSFLRLQQVDPGFDPRDVLTIRVSLPTGRYPDDSLVAGYWARALPRLREVAGVRAVGVGSAIPPNARGSSDEDFDVIDRPVPPGSAEPVAPWPTVSAEYFTVLGVPLLEGRLFTVADTGGATPVALVSRSWAHRYFPDAPVVGRKLIRGGCRSCPPTTIVGVVDDVPYAGLDRPADAVYSPVTEGWPRDLTVFVRTVGPWAEVLERVRRALRSVDPGVPLDDAAPMEDRLYASVARPRHWAVLLGGFAVTALALAAVGMFGMLSYTVSARRREIGVRMALGAPQGTVIRMIVGRGMGHALVGAGLGLVAALLATRTLASTLFGLSATDPTTLAAVTVLLLGVAAVACWLPARRAAMIDPATAIRLE